MAIGEITKKYFLSPREAINLLVGPATYENWDPADKQQKRVALRNLYKALQSGEVKASFSCFDGVQRKLEANQADDQFFTIDLDHDYCLFGSSQWPPNELKIDRDDLIQYLDKIHKNDEVAPVDDLETCTRWLVDRLSSATERRPLNKELGPEARRRWPNLSGRGYKIARKQALSRLGLHPSTLSGRPQKAKPSHSK